MDEVAILDSRPEWRDEFLHLAGELRGVLGERAIRIDHIGSTAIPGLAAKDVIDIQITITDLDGETVSAALTATRYRLNSEIEHDSLTGCDPDSPELRKKFLREPKGNRRAHLHIREQGRLNQAYPLLFRDYLRADAVAREAYASVKRELATRFGDDVEAYYAIKDPYMDTIYQAAKLWAKITRWQEDNEFR